MITSIDKYLMARIKEACDRHWKGEEGHYRYDLSLEERLPEELLEEIKELVVRFSLREIALVRCIEPLAAYAHSTWSGWMRYLFEHSSHSELGAVTISPELARRWKRQVDTSYEDLPSNEQTSDREEAMSILMVIRKTIG